MSDRDCERCVHSRPYGGENNNRCTSWDCEFIDRKEAIKAYREKMAEKESKTEPQTDVATYRFVEWENGERTIDAVEVVRCKDCKEFEAIGYCLFWGDDMDADDYCSHGVRKELADVPLP